MSVIIFDFDFTLADSLEVGLDAYNKAASILNSKKISEKDFDSIRNNSLSENIKYLQLNKFSVFLALAIAKYFFAKNSNQVNIYPEIVDQIKILKQKGYQLRVLSSNKVSTIKKVLANQNLLKYFDSIDSSPSLTKKHKKLIKIIGKYDLQRHNMIYVGDEDRDIIASKKVGIKVVAVSWGIGTREKLEQYKPNLIVDNRNELAKSLDKVSVLPKEL